MCLDFSLVCQISKFYLFNYCFKKVNVGYTRIRKGYFRLATHFAWIFSADF